MKILVVSDSHGGKKTLLRAYEYVLPDLTVHLGDHDADCSEILGIFPDAYIRSVRGNCDRRSKNLDIDEFTVGNLRFLMTHGHLFGVKTSLAPLIDDAWARNADVVLFGHTHIQYYAERGGMSIINPGSAGTGEKTFAVLTLEHGEIGCEFLSTNAL